MTVIYQTVTLTFDHFDWLIDWGLTPFLTISQSYHGGQFIYSCISWFSHTSTPHNNLPKQLAAFSHRLSPLVEDEWRMSQWRRKESWPSRDSNSQPLDWQPASLPTELPGRFERFERMVSKSTRVIYWSCTTSMPNRSTVGQSIIQLSIGQILIFRRTYRPTDRRADGPTFANQYTPLSLRGTW